MEIHGYSWDGSVYTGLRQFHQGKGFDPDSQEISRHLEYPLYQVSCELDVPFAHVEESDEFSEGEDDDPTSNEGLDDPPSRSWKIIMSAELSLILLLCVFWLYEY
ncbi:hypothetical protein B0H10DRAFT_1887139, partial [Mycena sp. CBHHK59/15]